MFLNDPTEAQRASVGSNWPCLRTWRLASTHQQDSHCHHSRSSGGNCAVHEDDVVFADVFGQTQVMQLARPRVEERGCHGYRGRKVTRETSVKWRGEKRQLKAELRGLKRICCGSPLALLNPRWSGSGSCRCGRPCTRPSGRAPSSRPHAGPTRR